MTATIDEEAADLRRANAELQRRLDERTAERDEALRRETATAEVLQVINSSPGDLAPVFDAILEKAHSLCGIAAGSLQIYDGEVFRAVAVRGLPERLTENLRQGYAPGPSNPIRRLIDGDRLVHVPDLAEIEDPRVRGLIPPGALGTLLGVALRKDDALLGAIFAVRMEVQPFTEKEIALLQNFAAQAVIAMENARLITETREALEQQTATSEVLQAINASPGDLAPVFDAMLEKAVQLCDANFGILWRFADGLINLGATYNAPAAFLEFHHAPRPATPDSGPGRLMRGEPGFAVENMLEFPPYAAGDVLVRAIVDLAGARSVVTAPLRKDATALGMITIYRQETRPFSDKQLALLQNFAAQAVIAMENARLIAETREALEQQTATAEVLGVINSSPGDLAPVFESILEKAHSLCGVAHGSLQLFDGETFRAVALHGHLDKVGQLLRQGFRPGPQHPLQQLLAGAPFAHVPDLAEIDDPISRSVAQFAGIRTTLFVALRKDAVLLGHITAQRDEVRPFTDKQIALLQNFAAQAVIAMENARLITETREALEQQTATAEVLQVINSSPGDLTPVFEAMLDKALRLCGAGFGVANTFDGERFHSAAERGVPAAFAEWRKRNVPAFGPGTAPARILAGENIVHTADLMDSEGYRGGDPDRRALVDLGAARTHLIVALRKDAALLGTLSIYRQEVRPFSDKQIALLQNFAAQAVIAMENARLITETREALEQQTATAEVLQVINASPGDLAPVFDAMVEKATRLCDAAFGHLYTYEGELFHFGAAHGDARYVDARRRLGPRGASSAITWESIVNGKGIVQIADCHDTDAYRHNPQTREAIEFSGSRTLLTVALRKDETLLGVLSVYRKEVRPFSEKQIALLENFAAQAVIAMENARLMTETREALDQQTATAEVLQVINSSPGDLAPVFDAMLERAMRLCEAVYGILWTYDDECFRATALRGLPKACAELFREPVRHPHPEIGLGRILRGEGIVINPDMAAEQAYLDGDPIRCMVDIAGARSCVQVSLRKDDVLLGAIVIFRREVRPFSDKQIALLQNFAAQAVIAMENARLITETSEALHQQTATAEVLQVINSSPGDLAPVFDAMLEKALDLCSAAFGVFWTYDGEFTHAAAIRGATAAYREFLSAPHQPGPGSAQLRLIQGERFVHVADLADSDDYRSGDALPRALVDLGGGRSLLAAPLRKDGAYVGAIMIYRQQPSPFSDKQIALLENFASQAVIAMENARLLGEIQQRQAELRVTFDNMGDGVVMFDENLRLAAWNRNFQELLELPDALLAEHPSFTDYLRILAERGEFGTENIEAELNRRLENTAAEFRAERTRPDGRIIEVRRNGVPGGGFVLIYIDITERKRSEAEIRAARDTAEAALRDLRAAQANLIQAEKMASLGQLTAGIAHEIKNPLNFVNNFAGLSVELLDELKGSAAPAIATLDKDKRSEIDETIEMLTGNLEKIAEHGRRADNIVKSMLEHSRGVSGERRKVDLNGLVEEALNLAYHGARAQDQRFNITMERDFDKALAPIELAPQEITRVFLNLFGNGFYAANKRAHANGEASFRPTLTVSTRDLGAAVEVKVRDNGTGIPPEIRDKLFQPFFTTKPTGEGTGLGLSISYDIVTQQHGGTITVESEPGGFTEFTVCLPRQ